MIPSIRDYFKRRDARRAARAEKAKTLWRRVTPAPGLTISRKVVEAQIDHLWSLLVRRRHAERFGTMCRICNARPVQCGYHIVPKQRGFAVRWLLANGTGACNPCNGAEMRNRSLYREKHRAIFGAEVVDALEQIAKTKRLWTIGDLLALRDAFKRMLETGNIWDGEAAARQGEITPT